MPAATRHSAPPLCPSSPAHHPSPAQPPPPRWLRGPLGCRSWRCWRCRPHPAGGTRRRAALRPGQSLEGEARGGEEVADGRVVGAAMAVELGLELEYTPASTAAVPDRRSPKHPLLSTGRPALTAAGGGLVLGHRDNQRRAVGQFKNRLDLALSIRRVCTLRRAGAGACFVLLSLSPPHCHAVSQRQRTRSRLGRDMPRPTWPG